jgi:hypothetical protein
MKEERLRMFSQPGGVVAKRNECYNIDKYYHIYDDLFHLVKVDIEPMEGWKHWAFGLYLFSSYSLCCKKGVENGNNHYE